MKLGDFKMNFQIVLNVVLLACNVVLIATEGQIEYLISVKTGNQYGAGTDANVYVQFHGINGSSVKNLLSNDCLDNFEQGMTDIFKIKAIDVGPINKVSVEHDNTGSKSAWFFESMRVLKPNAVIYDFSVNKWFKGVRDGHGRVLTSKTVHGTLPSKKLFMK